MNQHPQVDTGLEPCGLGVGREGHVFRACHSEQEAWPLILERGQTGTQSLHWVCFPSLPRWALESLPDSERAALNEKEGHLLASLVKAYAQRNTNELDRPGEQEMEAEGSR